MMKKQEAIEKLEGLKQLFESVDKGSYEKGFINALIYTLNVIKQLDEPEKPVVPHFVADWIEEAKEGECSLCTAFGLVDGDSRNFDWLFNGDKSNQDTFARAWLDGYEIEQEPLYTVEIPNPNINAHTVLQKTEKGIVLVSVINARWRGWADSKLTESEIKQDFDFLWQFAEEVEE
ncbi:DUF1642 domain-containing protein [Streptococcus infantarius]|uniref:DUF1642 domain-containing protein n=1 Tax=Streptococcus infantarius TaxID=102684 RepID=UPI003C2478F5